MKYGQFLTSELSPSSWSSFGMLVAFSPREKENQSQPQDERPADFPPGVIPGPYSKKPTTTTENRCSYCLFAFAEKLNMQKV